MTERLLYPAIDLLGGRLVHALRDSDSDGALALAIDDPIAAALRWRDQGAQWLHLVDLDGAREDAPRQLEIIRAIIQATGLPAQVAGGMHDMASVEAALDAGAERVVLSGATPDDQALVAECVARWGKRIAVALEARDGLVTVAGWLPSDAATALDVALAMGYLGVETLLFTSVTTSGESDALLSALRRAAPGMRLIAGGAVSSLDYLRRLFTLGMDGVLLGRALYAGLFTLDEAREVACEAGEAPSLSATLQEAPEREAEPAATTIPDDHAPMEAPAPLAAAAAPGAQEPELAETREIASIAAPSSEETHGEASAPGAAADND